ncbi:MAG: hypothetical protein HPY53_02845 [Brevinematales bacterium]|nr:hypothetical protein [Brevinematales bacterium]
MKNIITVIFIIAIISACSRELVSFSDKTPPIVQIISPTNFQEVGCIYTFSGIAYDKESSVLKILYKVDNSAWSNAVRNGDSWSASIFLTNEGLFTNTVYSIDKYGNKSSESIAIVSYSSLPGIIIQTPSYGSLTNVKSLLLTGIASVKAPNKIKTVQISVNGAEWTTASGTTNWTKNVSLLDGTNNIVALVITENNKTNSTAIHKIIVDLSMPSVSVESPVNPVTVNVTNITFSGHAFVPWPYDIISVSLRINDGTWIPAIGTTNWSKTLKVSAGSNSVVVCAVSDAGKTNFSVPVNVFCIISTPVIYIDSPANYFTTNSSKVTVKGTAAVDPPYSILSVSYKINGGAWKSASGLTNWSFTDICGQPTNHITVVTVSEGNNSNSASIVTYYTKPAISVEITNPVTNTVSIFPNFPISGIASTKYGQVQGVYIKVNNWSYALASGSTNWNYNVGLNSFSYGTNTIKVYALGLSNISSQTNSLLIIRKEESIPNITYSSLIEKHFSYIGNKLLVDGFRIYHLTNSGMIQVFSLPPFSSFHNMNIADSGHLFVLNYITNYNSYYYIISLFYSNINNTYTYKNNTSHYEYEIPFPVSYLLSSKIISDISSNGNVYCIADSTHYVYSYINHYHTETSLLINTSYYSSDFPPFGSIAVSGNGLYRVIGNPCDNTKGTNAGAMKLYKLISGNWVLQYTFYAAYPNAGDNFGSSVDISYDGGMIIVGAPYDGIIGTGAGSVTIFQYIGSWQSSTWVASDGSSGDNFGYSVSISADGKTAVAGSLNNDDKGADSGSVYVLKYINLNSWSQTKYLPSDGSAGNKFGCEVEMAPDGKSFAVGSSGNNSIYIFR